MSDILLVDDDDQLRTMMRLVLQRAGHTVREASDGHEAMSLFRDRPGDLIVTDLVMPEKEGLAVILEMRRINSQVKIVAMSGGGRVNPDNYLEVAKKFGAGDVLRKPFSNQELLDTVQRLLDQ
jgi:DNA-binding NtrC family response regulator